jgi:hypothetical protein
MPDIVLLPSDMRYLDSGMEFFSNKMFSRIDANSGAHRTNGVFVLWGSHVRRGLELQDVSIRDIAPTTLHLLGLPVPDDMDGQVVTQALDQEFLTSHPVVVTTALGEPEEEREGFASEDDEALIRQRLAGLGYLD